MKNKIRKLRQWFMNAMPGTYVKLSKFACRHVLYKNERRYLAGELEAGSDQASVIFVGGHRAASMFLQDVFTRLAGDAGLPRVDLAGYFVHTDRSRVEQLFTEGECETLFKKRGYFYGAMRRAVPLEDIGDYKVILVLRDLRDVLTSGYYSIVYAHTVIDEVHLEMKEKAIAQGVDAHVLDSIPAWRDRYVGILDWADECGIKVERYEDMISDFGSWLQRVAGEAGLGGNQELIDQIVSEAEFEVKSEDKTAHKRSVKAGSHAKKLKPETKRVLDHELRDLLERMGYED